jgi:hypothetical protein
MKGWIMLDKDMVDDPRMVEAALEVASGYVLAKARSSGSTDLDGPALLRFASNALLGALVTLWRYAHDHIRNDDTLPVRYEAIDALVGLEGFADAMPDCWLLKLDDGTVQLPGYVEKNGLIAKRKRVASNRERQARWRANHPKGNGAHNTNVTHNDGVTKCVDQDQDQDQDQSKKLRYSLGDLSPSSPSDRANRTSKKDDENRKRLEAALADATKRLTA